VVTILKKSVFIFLLFIQCFSSHAQVKEKQSIRIGGLSDQAFPPYLWHDACSGQIKGVLPAVIERMLGSKYELDFLPPIPTNPELWKQSLGQLINNDYDLQIAMYAPAPKGVLITDTPLAEYSKSIFYREGSLKDSEKALSRLKNKKGLILQAPEDGAEYRTLLRLNAEGFTIRYQKGIENAINLLANGEVDYIYGEHYYGSNAVYKLKFDEQISSFDVTEDRKGLYAAINASGPWTELIEKLNPELKAIQQTSLVDKLSQSYLSNWLRMSNCE